MDTESLKVNVKDTRQPHRISAGDATAHDRTLFSQPAGFGNQNNAHLTAEGEGSSVAAQAGSSESQTAVSETDSQTDVGKMFVGGLNWQTTIETLKEYFSKFGEVSECIIMRTPITRKSRGFGFVTFANPDDVNKVLAIPTHEVDGKEIDPKLAIPRKAQTNPKAPIVTKTKKAFVGGISAATTIDDLRTYFSQFGTVEDVTLMYDKVTQRHRGFGFITFATEEAVDKTCEVQYHEINGKVVECKKAQPREVLLPSRSRGRGFPGGYFPFSSYAPNAFGRGYPGFGMLPFYGGFNPYLPGFYPPFADRINGTTYFDYLGGFSSNSRPQSHGSTGKRPSDVSIEDPNVVEGRYGNQKSPSDFLGGSPRNTAPGSYNSMDLSSLGRALQQHSAYSNAMQNAVGSFNPYLQTSPPQSAASLLNNQRSSAGLPSVTGAARGNLVSASINGGYS